MLTIESKNSQISHVLGNKSSEAITLVDISKTDEMLACLHEFKFFTSLELKCAYYHRNLIPETK